MSPSRRLAVAGLFLIGLYGAWGIGWGLPSVERNHLFLRPETSTPEFLVQVAQAREDLYTRMGGSPIAYFGRLLRTGESNHLPTVMNSYSSFLLKTHNLDESATLVMLSKINPLKNRWYPSMFLYGGAYLYPLGVILGGAHLAHVIHLVASPVYYFTHPQDIARMYVILRGWSLVGLLVACAAVFVLGRRLAGERAGVWAMLFFGLAPTSLVNSKFAKPHTWGGALSLWAIVYALEAKEEGARASRIALAASFFGLSIGMTVSQVVYLPILLWAVWTDQWPLLWRRVLLLFGTIGGVYLCTNFYLLAHIQDYLGERYFLSHYAPFRVTAPALRDFVVSMLRVSLGWELWVVAMAGLIWALVQRDRPVLRQIGFLVVLIGGYLAFQFQALNGWVMASRYFLALIGILCVLAARVTETKSNLGTFACGVCLAALLVKGAAYDANFASDRVPRDNASQAALWVQSNVAPQSLIAQPLVAPQPDCFPPLPFDRYRIISFRTPEFENPLVPAYAIVSPPTYPRLHSLLMAHGFMLVQSFASSPLQRLGFEDDFTLANFPVEIYGRNRSH